jgi:uncharacterized membrane protein
MTKRKSAMLFDVIMFGSIGILYIALGVPLALGKIPPNGGYGFRTPRTLSDPRIWYEANRISGYDIIIAGAAILVLSMVTIYLGHRHPGLPVTWINLAILMVATLGAFAHSAWFLGRL